MDDSILFEQVGPVAYVTFNRPASRNAMTFAMYERLYNICDQIEDDDSIRVLVLRGAGSKAFIAGTDISQFLKFVEPQDALDYEKRIDRIIGRLESVAKPTIAQVQGYAVGGGATVALVCDLRVGTPDLQIGIPIARTLGNCLSMSNYTRLVDLLGPARTKDLIFRARMIGADEALSLGLVSEVVPPEQIEERVAAIATQIASHAPLTLKATKEAVRRIQDQRRHFDGKDLILSCYMSEDFHNAVQAFLEKRVMEFQGR